MAKKGNGRTPLYGAYVFLPKEKEPAIDEFRTLVESHFGHRVKNKDLAQIHDAGGPSTAAMHGWLFGKTLRPQNSTMEAAGRALGWRRQWVRMGKNAK